MKALAEKRTTQSGQVLYAGLIKDVKAGQIKPVYLLWGEETFLIADIVKRLKQQLLAAEALELDFSTFDADGLPARLDWIKIRTELQTPPFLSVKRVLYIKNSGLFKAAVNLSPDQNEAMEACLAHQASWACLIFKEEKVDKRTKKLLNIVQQHGSAVELTRMDLNGLINWSAAYLKRYDLKISRLAAESLIDRCEADMQKLSNELNKLRLYAQSVGLRELNQAEIDGVSVPDLRGSIFDLTDALAVGDAGKALRLYRLLRQNKEAGSLILFMLARHIKQLACARSAGREELLSALMKLPPFVLRRLIQQSKRFNIEQLGTMYTLCHERDRLIKWGKMDEEIALEALIVALAATLR